MKDRTRYECGDCRWCEAGERCKFWDTNQREVVQENRAPTCPFYEDINLARKLGEVAAELRVIGGQIGCLL